MDESLAQQKARIFLGKVNASGIPLVLSPYLKAVSAKFRVEYLADGESGYTLTKPDGTHIITVNGSETEERKRFTACHEIAHIELELPSNHSELPSWSYAKRDFNEVMCDVFAAELLMPHQIWKARMPNTEPSVAAIQALANEFRVSFHAAASRYASLADFPCALVTMERGFVRHAARSTALRRIGAWISPRSKIPSGSLAQRVRASGSIQAEIEEVAQDVWFEGWANGFDLWELALHYHQFDTTLSLLWFAEEDLPSVEIDRFGARLADDGGLAELTGQLAWPGRSRRR